MSDYNIQTTNVLAVDGNWGDYNVSTGFVSTDEKPTDFFVNISESNQSDRLFLIEELEEIIKFAKAEFDRQAPEYNGD